MFSQTPKFTLLWCQVCSDGKKPPTALETQAFAERGGVSPTSERQELVNKKKKKVDEKSSPHAHRRTLDDILQFANQEISLN